MGKVPKAMVSARGSPDLGCCVSAGWRSAMRNGISICRARSSPHASVAWFRDLRNRTIFFVGRTLRSVPQGIPLLREPVPAEYCRLSSVPHVRLVRLRMGRLFGRLLSIRSLGRSRWWFLWSLDRLVRWWSDLRFEGLACGRRLERLARTGLLRLVGSRLFGHGVGCWVVKFSVDQMYSHDLGAKLSAQLTVAGVKCFRLDLRQVRIKLPDVFPL